MQHEEVLQGNDIGLCKILSCMLYKGFIRMSTDLWREVLGSLLITMCLLHRL